MHKTLQLTLHLKKTLSKCCLQYLINQLYLFYFDQKLCNLKNPVTLYTSGANTQIIAQSNGKYRIFGETMDIGVGNFLDNIGRYMNKYKQ